MIILIHKGIGAKVQSVFFIANKYTPSDRFTIINRIRLSCSEIIKLTKRQKHLTYVKIKRGYATVRYGYIRFFKQIDLAPLTYIFKDI